MELPFNKWNKADIYKLFIANECQWKFECPISPMPWIYIFFHELFGENWSQCKKRRKSKLNLNNSMEVNEMKVYNILNVTFNYEIC